MPREDSQLASAAVPVWNVETLRAHVVALLAALDARMTERHEAAQKAIELAFSAQKDDIQAAFMSQKEALSTAFLAQKEAVNAALASADRAVSKAELASEKRFESVNEFRATLADQQRTLMPRSESEANNRALSEKLDTNVQVLTDKIAANTRALTTSHDVKTGEKFGWQYAVAVIGLVMMILGALAYFKAH